MERKIPFYGWFVLLLLVVIAAGPMVWLSNTFSYYQVPICDELGCTYFEFSLCNTSSMILNILFGILVASKLSGDKTRYWMAGGALLAGACMYLIGNATNVWMIIALKGLADFCFSAVSFIPINILISDWFVDKRATATSIVMAGMGIGGTVFTPVVAALIAQGWRNALHVTALVVAGVPLLVFWFLKKPHQVGQTALMPKESAQTAAEDAAPKPSWEGLTKKEAVKTGAFIFYALVCICCGMAAAGVSTQMPAFFTDNGLDYTSRMTVFNFFFMLGFLVMGVVIDKLGMKAGGALTGGMIIASMLCLIVAPQSAVLSYVAVILFPLGISITNLAPPLLAGSTFGTKEYGGIYGLGNSCYMAGCMAGPLASSAIRTAVGSYSMAWSLFAVVAAILILGIFACAAKGKKLCRQA